MANVTPHRWGGMLAAAHYLKEFVAEGVQWAHIDVAGPAYNTGGPFGLHRQGRHGVPVRTMITRPRGHRPAGLTLAVSPSGPPRAKDARAAAAAYASRARLRRIAAGRRIAHALRIPGLVDVVHGNVQILTKSAGPRSPPTGRRVHSPAFATSTTVTSVTVVSGSTKASTPVLMGPVGQMLCVALGCQRLHCGRRLNRSNNPTRGPPRCRDRGRTPAVPSSLPAFNCCHRHQIYRLSHTRVTRSTN